ncbi:hypothetical protein V6U77_10235 [Micromonospora sp. CPCC 205546]
MHDEILRPQFGRIDESTLSADPATTMSDTSMAIERWVRGQLTEAVPTRHVDRSRDDSQATVTASPGASVRPPRNGCDRLGNVIATGSSRAEVVRRIHTAVDQVQLLVDEDRPDVFSDDTSLAPAH